MKSLRLLLFAPLFFLFAACGKSDSPKAGAPVLKFNERSYVEVQAGTLSRTDTSLSGIGSIAFVEPLSGVTTNHGFQASLAIEDGGSLSLVGFANNRLESGVTIKFVRQGDILKVSLLAGGSEKDISANFAGEDASSTLSFHIDIHNSESPSHLLIWPGSATVFTEDTAIFNSESDGEAPGAGAGTFWGFVLNRATLAGASVGAAKFSE